MLNDWGDDEWEKEFYNDYITFIFHLCPVLGGGGLHRDSDFVLHVHCMHAFDVNSMF